MISFIRAIGWVIMLSPVIVLGGWIITMLYYDYGLIGVIRLSGIIIGVISIIGIGAYLSDYKK